MLTTLLVLWLRNQASFATWLSNQLESTIPGLAQAVSQILTYSLWPVVAVVQRVTPVVAVPVACSRSRMFR
jgi:hypothetical protein